LQIYSYFHKIKILILSRLDGIELTKLYYSIGEVAALFGVNTSLIRFWEKEFTIIQPKKNKKGNRLFTVKDIENFNKIYNLVKLQGYTLDGAKKALKGKDSAIPVSESFSAEDVISRLEKIRRELLRLKK
jgi:DNA-binding transcriptional MerR regulator